MLLPLVYARTAIFDSTLTLCTTAAILWFFEERPVLAWAAMAAGALTKGPLAIALPLLVLVPHALATGLPLRRLFSWRAVGAFALIALPWFIAVSIRVPAFPYYLVVRETLQRVTTGTFHRTAPFWYFFPIVPVAAFPWIVPALARTRTWRATWRARRAPSAREPLLFASWIIVPLVFFTLNQSKLPQYVLPLMPAFVLAAVRNLVTPAAAEGAGPGRRSYPVVAVLAGAALVALTHWLPAPIDLTPAEKAAIPPTALALGVVLFVSAACVAAGALIRRPRAVIAGYAMVVMAIPLVSGRLLAAVGADRSAAALPRGAARARRARRTLRRLRPVSTSTSSPPSPAPPASVSGREGAGMCGIFGAVSLAGRPLRHPGCLGAMAAALAHRGPDGEQIVGPERARIGALRLAISHLTTADQPFLRTGRHVWLVGNA